MELQETHLTAQEIEEYRHRTLSPLARRRCDRHIAACEGCFEQVLGEEHASLASAQLWEAFIASEVQPFHISSADLKRFVSGRADEADKTIFESHLENCRACSEAHASLLRKKIRPTISSVRGESDTSRLSFWEQLSSGWRTLITPGRMAAASALAACLLVSLVVWHYEINRNLGD